MLDWDHNAYYHRLLLRGLPADSPRVLDVGCGAGLLASKLAHRVGHVDAIDRSPAMIARAAERSPANVACILGDAMTHPLPERSYDAIVSMSALHHMELESALRRLAALLRPGGVLTAIALPRTEFPADIPAEILAGVGHRVLGGAFSIARVVGRGEWFAKEPTHSAMPVVTAPELTVREVSDRAAAVLPGARVRRLVFWRYLLCWEKA